jgi:hypothetical protein
MEKANNVEIDSGDVSIKELLIKLKNWSSILKPRLKLILALGLLGGSLGYGITFLVKPTYKAVLTFAMEEDKGGGSGLSGAIGLASSFGIDLGGANGGGAFAASNLTELMKSRLIVEKVLLKPINIQNKNISLLEHYIQFKNLRKDWTKNPRLKDIKFGTYTDRKNFSVEQDSILIQIYKNLIDKKNLNIQQKDKKVTILSIEVNSENEFFSKYFCENLAKETSEFYVQTKSKKAKINVDVLQRQVDSVRFQLNGAITGVAAEVDNVYNLNPAYNVRGSASKKKQIDVQANTAILTNLVVQLELAKITLRKETPLIQLIDQPIFPLDKDQLGTIKTSLLGFILSLLLTTLIIILKNSINKEIF